jgi:hypothetical protein
MHSESGQYSDRKQQNQKLYSHDDVAFILHCTQSILGHICILVHTL